MIQLTSDAALVSSIILHQISLGQYINHSQHPKSSFLIIFPMLTTQSWIDSLINCLGCCLFPDPLPLISRSMTVFQLRSIREIEEKILTFWSIYLPGAFNCEYKSWERIHRDMADSRLLAIPAS